MRHLAVVLFLTLLCVSPMLGQDNSAKCTLDMQLTSDGPLFNYITGKPYALDVTLTNSTKSEIVLDGIEVAWKADKNLTIDIKPVGDAPAAVAPGKETKATYTVTFPQDAGNQVITLTGNAKSQSIVAKGELHLLVTPQLELTMLPARMILEPSPEAKRVGISVINHMDKEFSGKVKLTPSQGIKVSPSEQDIKIDSYGLEAFIFSVEPEAALVPGHYAVFVDVGDSTRDWVAVDVPVFAKKAAGTIAVDGNLDEWTDQAKVAIAKLIDGSKWETIGKAMLTYDDANIYMAIEVNDDEHTLSPDSKSRAKAEPPSDTIVIGFDQLIDGAKSQSGGYKDDDCEITLCGAEGGSVALLTWADGKAQETETGIPVAFVRNGTKSCYEVAIPWGQAKHFKPEKNAKFAMSLLVNDSDGSTLTQTEWGGGLAGQVDPRKFLPVVLSE